MGGSGRPYGWRVQRRASASASTVAAVAVVGHLVGFVTADAAGAVLLVAVVSTLIGSVGAIALSRV